MSDQALSQAYRRRDDIAVEINRLQQRLDELRRDMGRVNAFIDDWHEFAGIPQPPTGLPGTLPPKRELPPSPSTDAPKRRNSKKEAVADAAYALIEERGAPMSRSELYVALTAQGYVIQGADPEMVLSTMLWRMRNRIVRLKGGGYWAADKLNREHGYDPRNVAAISTSSGGHEIVRMDADDTAPSDFQEGTE